METEIQFIDENDENNTLFVNVFPDQIEICLNPNGWEAFDFVLNKEQAKRLINIIQNNFDLDK